MKTPIKTYPFLKGGGEMGALTRNHDWSQTPIGAPDAWPQSLRTTLSILLNSKFPMFLFWGPEHTCFYNDAFRPSLGNSGKHPAILGKPGIGAWPETWSFIGPMIHEILDGSDATWFENQCLPIYRNGKLEDGYWTFSYSPVRDESGNPAGVLVTCMETTEAVKSHTEIEEGKQRFQNLVRDATVGIVVLTGEEMRVEIVNESYGRLINLTPDALIGKKLFDLIPDAEAYYLPILTKVRQTGAPVYLYDSPYSVVTNGHLIEGFLNVVYQPYKDADGTLNGVMALCQDVTQQVLSRKKLEESERTLRDFILKAPIAIAILRSKEYVVEIVNVHALEFWGRTYEDVINRPLFDCLPELRTQGFKDFFDAIYDSGNPVSLPEHPIEFMRNGKLDQFYFNFSYEVLYGADGQVNGLMAVGVDVTLQTKARMKIQDAEQRAQLAIESADLGTYEIDLKTDEMHTSPRFQAIWGMTNTLDRNAYAKKIHPDDLDVREKATEEAFTTGKIYYEARLITGTDTIKWVRVRGTVLFDQQQKPDRLLGVIQDISEQKLFADELKKQVHEQTEELMQAHLALVQTNDYLQSIINIFNIPLQVLQPLIEDGEIVDFRYKLTNSAYANYAGTSPKELENRLVSEFFPGYFKTDSFVKIAEAYKTGQAHKWENYYNVDGLDIYNEMCATVMNGEVIVYFTDFTTMKRLQLNLSSKVAELERSNQNLEEFAHAASHDLKEPIRKVHLFSNMLKRSFSSLNQEQQHLFERVEDAVQRMGLLIDDLLEYSHVSMGVDLLEEINLNKKVAIVLTDLEVAIQEKSAIITVENLPTIRGQRRQLQQLFHNLIQNALKYSIKEVAPRIAITSEVIKGSNTSFSLTEEERNKSFHLIKIKDNGIGFEQQHAEQIFQMFKRLHGKGSYTGSGVGLAIVKKVVENHNGYIKAESKPGEGATFEILIPA